MIAKSVSEALASIHALNFETLMKLAFETDTHNGISRLRTLKINGVAYPVISLVGYQPLEVESVQIVENGLVRDFNKQTGFSLDSETGSKGVSQKNLYQIKPTPQPKGLLRLNSLVS